MTSKYDASESYANRASAKMEQGEIVSQDVTDCETCGEILAFAMRDKHHEFSLGLYTVLQCLRAAEKEGVVPPLPDEWWIAVGGLY